MDDSKPAKRARILRTIREARGLFAHRVEEVPVRAGNRPPVDVIRECINLKMGRHGKDEVKPLFVFTPHNCFSEQTFGLCIHALEEAYGREFTPKQRAEITGYTILKLAHWIDTYWLKGGI
jgi:hypothetical protein